MMATTSTDEVPARIRACYHKVVTLLQRWQEPDEPYFEIRDEIVQLLRDNDLYRKMRFPPRHVGIHFKNRYGDGIIPSHVLTLTERFATGGFSEPEIGVPLATEMPPDGHERAKRLEDFMERLLRECQGVVPAYDKGDIKIISCEKTHSNQACRAVNARIQHPNEELCDEKGRIDPNKINQKAPKFATVCHTGFEWNYLLWQAEDAFEPYGLIECLQETANAGQAVAMPETRLEACLKAVQNAQKACGIDPKTGVRDDKAQKMDENKVWEKVEKIATRGKPEFVKEIPDLIKYVRALSGGLNNPKYIQAVVSYQRSLQNPRIIYGHILASVAEALLGPDGRGCTEFRIDCIRAMLGASDKYSNNGVQSLFISTDFTVNFKKKNVLVEQANKMKDVGIALVAEHAGAAANHAVVQSALDLFGIRLVHYVGEKPDPLKGVFGSMHDIGYTFVQDLATLLNKEIQSPWAPSAKLKNKDVDEAPKKTGVLTFDNAGKLNRVEQLVNLGAKKDAMLQLKDESKWRIVALTDDSVELSGDKGAKKMLDTASCLKGLLGKEIKFIKIETTDRFSNDH